MRDFMENASVVCVAPEAVCQLGSYELDLLRLCYFSWINTLSLGINVWQQQFISEADGLWSIVQVEE